MSGRLPVPITCVLSVLFASPVQAEYALHMTQGVTSIGRDIYGLHMIIFWICVAIGVVVFAAMAWSVLHHRKSRGAEAANFHESTTIEIVWTVIPMIILIAIAIPATGTLLDLEDTEFSADIEVQVTAIQLKWKYNYLDEGVEFISSLAQSSRDVVKNPGGNENDLLEVDEPIVLPINKKIRFLFTSDDVIHARWVPELAVKQDATPGFINDSWLVVEKPGIYRGQCAELCGKDHGFMPIVVKAVSEAEYRQWIADRKSDAVAIAASAE
ncbi:MAG: cytochrome c oxidase subunit II [Gammaproteobacteria bacterium]|nr:cytochrome c oxidase subunit II [Gammaproteobacteria bacterium]